MHSDVSEILTRANRLLAADASDFHYVTLAMARLDPRDRSMVYASAGQRGYLLGAGIEATVLDSTSLPLGVHADTVVPAASPITLKSGDLLTFFTDGLAEAESPGRVRFGVARALQIIRSRAREAGGRHYSDAPRGSARLLSQPAATRRHHDRDCQSDLIWFTLVGQTFLSAKCAAFSPADRNVCPTVVRNVVKLFNRRPAAAPPDGWRRRRANRCSANSSGRARGHPTIDALLRGNHRAVAAAAEIVADFAQSGPGVLAGQPHRQHPRMADPFRLAVGLQASRLQPKDVADGLLDVGQPHRPAAMRGSDRPRLPRPSASEIGRPIDWLVACSRHRAPESSRAWLVKCEATNCLHVGGHAASFIRRAIWPTMPSRVA